MSFDLLMNPAEPDGTHDDCREVALSLRKRAEKAEQALDRIAEVLAANGCDCDCSDVCCGEHDPSCVRCLACRVELAWKKEG